jgi:hypothetical protein
VGVTGSPGSFAIRSIRWVLLLRLSNRIIQAGCRLTVPEADARNAMQWVPYSFVFQSYPPGSQMGPIHRLRAAMLGWRRALR